MNNENTDLPVNETADQIEQMPIEAPRSKNTEPVIESQVDEVSDAPTNDFLNFALSEEIQKGLAKLKFTKATPIQKACIPFLLENESDIVALAKTGTGKTAAFGLPLVEKLEAGAGMQALVLCPTRELAQQVALMIKNFGEFKKMKVATVVGGESYDKQIRAIKSNPEILVSTPGRLVDLMEQKIIDLSDVKYLVLDEADEMLSFGFEEALETIWKATSKQDLKTWLFSATMSKMIRNLAAKYLKKAHEVTLNTQQEKILVDSYACVIFEEDKEDALSLLIKNTPEFYGIIFATTKKQVAELEVRLRGLGLDVDSLHGDKVQADRTRTIERMKHKRTKILVATDVAARGLDIQDLTHVVNFEIPWDVETYTHRVGRTARAGKTGIVWTMVKPKESPKLSRFEKALGHTFKNLRIPLVEEVQVKQKMNWLNEIATRNVRETDVTRFAKAVDQLENAALTELSIETKQWLAKAFDYFGQGEELRMKQPRSLELRSSESRSSDRSFDDSRPRFGGRGGSSRDGGGYRGRSDSRDGGSSRGDSRGPRRDYNDRAPSSSEGSSESRPQSRWGFRDRNDQAPRSDRGGSDDRGRARSDSPDSRPSTGESRGFRGAARSGARPATGGSRGGRTSSGPRDADSAPRRPRYFLLN